MQERPIASLIGRDAFGQNKRMLKNKRVFADLISPELDMMPRPVLSMTASVDHGTDVAEFNPAIVPAVSGMVENKPLTENRDYSMILNHSEMFYEQPDASLILNHIIGPAVRRSAGLTYFHYVDDKSLCTGNKTGSLLITMTRPECGMSKNMVNANNSE